MIGLDLLIGAALSLAPAGSEQQPEYMALPLPPAEQLAEHRRLDAALDRLLPQRPGTVDAYVVVVALDGDPVFNREAREAGRVLASRFDAAGRTVVLANDEGGSKGDAPGSPQSLEIALARVAELMDRNEDVLVLYSTSHGEPNSGLIYKDLLRGAGVISPARLADDLKTLGIRNRLLILQACFSGQFVPVLKDPNSIVRGLLMDLTDPANPVLNKEEIVIRRKTEGQVRKKKLPPVGNPLPLKP